MTTGRYKNNEGPTFLGIGSQRCATSYLNQILEAHPQVQMAPKERNFFNYNVRQRGLDWYLQYFQSKRARDIQAQARGEISPNYAIMRRREIRLTHDLFPYLKIILIVRHPVDRMWSALRRHWTYSYLDDVAEIGTDVSSILNYADQRLSDAFGDYQAIYKNWTSIFGKGKVLLLRFDQMKKSPDRTVAQVLSFIGAEPDIDWVRSYRENASIRNQKVDVQMPPYVRYYLSHRYLRRTEKFNALTGGLVQDWVSDMERQVSDAPRQWRGKYWIRSLVRYWPVQWAHRIADPIRMRWKAGKARQRLAAAQV